MPTSTDTEIREALGAIREIEPTDAAVHRATIAARPQPQRVRRRRIVRAAIAASTAAAVATAVVASLPSSDSERPSARDVLLGAAAVAAEQPAMPSDGYRYSQVVRHGTTASMLRGCATCVGSVTWEQREERWSPPDWREGRRHYGDMRIVESSGDEQRQRELRELRYLRRNFEGPRLLADPLLQDIPFADLPTDAVALRDLLQAAVLDLRWAGRAREAVKSERDELNEGRPPTLQQARDQLIQGVINVLGDANITPRLRSAFFGVLATVDGARALGRVTDPLGRSGEGVAFDLDRDDAVMDNPAIEQRIIFDPETSELLAVSWTPRDPNERPAPKPQNDPDETLKDHDVTWIQGGWTAYVRTGNVAKVGERP